jgi:hypothetical protein
MEKFSKVVSYIFHPLIIPTLGILVLFNSGTYLSYLPFDMKKWMLVIVFLCTFIVPVAFIPYLIYQKLLWTVKMEIRSERYIPLVVSFVFNLFCYYLIQRIPAIPDVYSSFLLSSILAILLTLVVTVKYKISIHMVGAGGLVALIAYLAFNLKVDLQFYLAISIFLAGLIGTARLILKAHSPDQIYLGFLAGFSVVFATLSLS